MTEQTQAAAVPATRSATRVASPKPWNLTPSNMGEALKYAEMLAKSGLVPKHYVNNPGAVLVAVQMGQEVGMAPMQSVQNIAVINGHPSIWGDALPALAKRHPQYEWMNTTYDEQRRVATCRIKRKGEPEEVRTFSWSDAETAGLARKDTYKNYPQRMLMTRARAWAIRDVFPDALKGLYVAEEAIDIPADDYHVVPPDAEVLPDTETHGVDGLADHLATVSDGVAPDDGGAVSIDEETGEIVVDVVDLKRRLDEAADLTELETIGREFNALEAGEIKSALRKHYRRNLDRLMDEGESSDEDDTQGATSGDSED